MNTQQNTITNSPPRVAQLALSMPGALAVFTRYNIDYCCGGHRSLEEGCMRAGLEANEYGNVPLTITLQSPLHAMEDEHELAGKLTKSIRNLSNNYTVPEYACPTYRITYQKLKQFDADLMMHIHLENNILFERVKSKGIPALD